MHDAHLMSRKRKGKVFLQLQLQFEKICASIECPWHLPFAQRKHSNSNRIENAVDVKRQMCKHDNFVVLHIHKYPMIAITEPTQMVKTEEKKREKKNSIEMNKRFLESNFNSGRSIIRWVDFHWSEAKRTCFYWTRCKSLLLFYWPSSEARARASARVHSSDQMTMTTTPSLSSTIGFSLLRCCFVCVFSSSFSLGFTFLCRSIYARACIYRLMCCIFFPSLCNSFSPVSFHAENSMLV